MQEYGNVHEKSFKFDKDLKRYKNSNVTLKDPNMYFANTIDINIVRTEGWKPRIENVIFNIQSNFLIFWY